MKHLNEYITESMSKQISESKSPKAKTTAWDYNGDPVEIVSVLIGGDEDEDQFVKKYDKSGDMAEELDDLRDDIIDGKVTLVAVKRKGGSPNDTAVFVWGPEGVCYENK